MKKQTRITLPAGLIAALLALTGLFTAWANGGNATYLPVAMYDAAPTPIPTPTVTPHAEAAAFYITPAQGLNASTFNTGAFTLDNQSLNGQRLVRARIDLSTAVFMDMVFDPFGVAGDVVAKDLAVDGKAGISYLGRTYEAEHDGGYDVLVLDFANFDPGESFIFSVDVDPTTIRGTGAPGPGESGSVCGLELTGATITVTYENGVTLSNEVFHLPRDGQVNCGAWAQLRAGQPPEPGISVIAASPPAVVGAANQVVRVSGPAGYPVVVAVLEGAQYLQGLPGGGYDVDPFEANSVITMREYPGTIGPGGTVDIPVVLSRSGPEAGYNLITAVLDNHYGLRGPAAGVIVLELAE
jgi:hypothetical protein